MAEPLRTAARLLAELPPFLSFMRSIQDHDLPSQGGSGRLEVPDPAFWRASADDVLQELRLEPHPPNADVKKAGLRRLLQRAQTRRRVTQRFAAEGGRVEQLLALRGASFRNTRSLPPGIVEVISGLYFADLMPDGAANPSPSPAAVARQLQVDDVIVLDAKQDGKEPSDLWSSYRLFEDRLVLLFDQGKQVLAIGPPEALSCMLYGLLVRYWQFSSVEGAEYLRRVGRDPDAVPEAFQQYAAEPPNGHRLLLPGCDQPRPASLALRAHVRLLEESRHWQLQRAEPLVRATEALLARAVGWEPHQHDAASPGSVCLAALRTLRTELSTIPNKRHFSNLRDLVSVAWRIGNRMVLEEGLLMEPISTDGEPCSLETEVAFEMQKATRLPQLFIIAIEGSRPVTVGETITLEEQRTVYRTYGMVLGNSVLTRGKMTTPLVMPTSAEVVGESLLLLQPPAVVVLVLDRLASQTHGNWTPWADFINFGGRAPQVPRPLAQQTFQVRLVTIAQCECAKRCGRRAAWDQVDVLGVSELPVDAPAALLQQRLATELQVPVSRQLLLTPASGDRGWNCLLPKARVVDHAVSPFGGAGPMVLVLGILTETMAAPRTPRSSPEQEALAFLTMPYVPVLCHAWVERQLVPLEVVILDARRPLASYAWKISKRIEEELGSRPYCSAFAAYELPPPSAQASPRPLQMTAPLATELATPQPGEACSTLPVSTLLWEAVPLSPSMTGRGLLAAHDMACLPNLVAREKQLPLDRIAPSKREDAAAAPPAEPAAASSYRVAEDYTAFILLQERLLVAWAEDGTEAVAALVGESRRRLHGALGRLRAWAPSEPPPGLKEWPSEEIAQWTSRTWEKVCKAGAALQTGVAQSPTATVEEVMRTLMWAELSTLQDIITSLEAIKINRKGRMTLGGKAASHAASGAGKCGLRTFHIGGSLEEVTEAERQYSTSLLMSKEPEELFNRGIPDLQGECDSDITGLHGYIKGANTELNGVWTQRRAVLAQDEKELWHVVQLRMVAITMLHVLLKKAHSSKAPDGLVLESLQQVQQDCAMILYKSQLLYEAASAIVAPVGDEDAVAAAFEELLQHLDESAESMKELHRKATAPEEKEKPSVEQAEQVLDACDSHMLHGNFFLQALERQVEGSWAPEVPQRITRAIEAVQDRMHELTPMILLIRALFGLTEVDTHRAMKLPPTRHRRRPGTTPTALKTVQETPPPVVEEEPDPSALQEAAAKAADAQAQALLRAEEQARSRKDAKKKKQRTRKAAEEPPAPAPPQHLQQSGKSPSSGSVGRAAAPAPPEAAAAKDEALGGGGGGGGGAAEPGPGSKACTTGGGGGGGLIRSGASNPVEPEEEAAPEATPPEPAERPPEKPAPPAPAPPTPPAPVRKDVEERLLLEKGPFELLGERRKARLLEIESVSGASCTLDAVGQGVRLLGTVAAVASARKLLEDLCVEWVDVAAPVWVVMLQGRNCAGGHLSRLQAEAQCSVVVDRTAPRIRVSGTARQVDAAQEWLWQLHGDCDSAQVSLGSLEAPEALVLEATKGCQGLKVELTRQKSGCSANVQGLQTEVQRVAEQLRAAALRASAAAPRPAPAAPPAAEGGAQRAPAAAAPVAAKAEEKREAPASAVQKDPTSTAAPAAKEPSGTPGGAGAPAAPGGGARQEAPAPSSNAAAPARSTPPAARAAQASPRGWAVGNHPTAGGGAQTPSDRGGSTPKNAKARSVSDKASAPTTSSPPATATGSEASSHTPRSHPSAPAQPAAPTAPSPPAARPAAAAAPEAEAKQPAAPTATRDQSPPAVQPRNVGTGLGLGAAKQKTATPAAVDGTKSALAESLAQQFPMARIVVGAPDEQIMRQQSVSVAATLSSAGLLEVKMQRLKELLEKDKRQRCC